MIADCSFLKIFPIVRYELFHLEHAFTVKSRFVALFSLVLKHHYKYSFKVLSCISGVDYPKKKYRFQIVYDFLSLKFNKRTRFKTYASELSPINSIVSVFKCACWWECEVWDMFGVFFYKNRDLRRILTDYGFEGFPLRKDFPLSGFFELRYNSIKDHVVSEKLSLSQEYRVFEYKSPWDLF